MQLASDPADPERAGTFVDEHVLAEPLTWGPAQAPASPSARRGWSRPGGPVAGGAAAEGMAWSRYRTGAERREREVRIFGCGRELACAFRFMLFALSVAMLGSMHAVQFNHLRHHRHCLDEEDVETRSARMAWWQALLWGPVFPLLLHATALNGARPRVRRWIRAELIANGLVIGSAAFVVPFGPFCYHVTAMVLAHCLTAFFAVWTVHHDCEPGREIAGMADYRGFLERFDAWFESYPGETFASSVFVARTLTLTHGLSHVNQNVR